MVVPSVTTLAQVGAACGFMDCAVVVMSHQLSTVATVAGAQLLTTAVIHLMSLSRAQTPHPLVRITIPDLTNVIYYLCALINDSV